MEFLGLFDVQGSQVGQRSFSVAEATNGVASPSGVIIARRLHRKSGRGGPQGRPSNGASIRRTGTASRRPAAERVSTKSAPVGNVPPVTLRGDALQDRPRVVMIVGFLKDMNHHAPLDGGQHGHRLQGL